MKSDNKSDDIKDIISKYGLDLNSSLIEIMEPKTIQFNYLVRDKDIYEIDIDSARKLLSKMHNEKVITVDTEIKKIKNEEIHGYLIGAKDTLQHLQEVYEQMEKNSTDTNALMKLKPFDTQNNEKEIKHEMDVNPTEVRDLC